ncbi:MAG TPA: sensor histidine kinase [Bryobacteraceae bacterium]|nr:sensor histidine kinase [Bryobacteraceae bacterium]
MDSTSEALKNAHAEIQILSAHLITAQEEERCRMARDLHDDLGQRAAMIGIQLDNVARFVHEAEGAKALSLVRTNLDELAAGLEEVSHRLHPSIVTNLGLSVALNQLVEQFNAAGGSAKFKDRSGAPVFDPAIGTALYRIAQEALRNIRKHARGARVRVTLARQRDKMYLFVEDNGPGFEASAGGVKHGLGLLSMRERARLIGGTLTVKSQLGEGTLILACAPVNSDSTKG